MKRFIVIIFCLLAVSLFVRSAQLPEHVKKALDEHVDVLKDKLVAWNQSRQKNGTNTVMPEWLPGYIIKHDITRVPNAEKLKRIVQLYELKTIRVPQKYIYQVFNKESEPPTEENSVVVAEVIAGNIGCYCSLSNDQSNQLWSAAEKAGHKDLHCKNYIVASDGKVYIIDTDSIAMNPCETTKPKATSN